MCAPTRVPSAKQLAQLCADQYTEITRTPLPTNVRFDLDRIADRFLELHRFRDLLRLIPWELFSHNPNSGHTTIADLLCCGALALAVTTNYDTHVEDAALVLGEHDFQSALNGTEADELSTNHSPFLKLHGCHRRDRSNTLWSRSQLDTDTEIRRRIDNSTTWLRHRLAHQDVVVLGFSTDWEYLNQALTAALVGSEPRTVVIVDPLCRNQLEEKAPQLLQWASQQDFTHVPDDADVFLDELRLVFSQAFVRRALDGGVGHFNALFPTRDVHDMEFVDTLTSDDLYSLRKDLAGCSSRQPARMREPDNTTHLVGAFVRAIMAAGGNVDGPNFTLRDEGIRVLNCPNRLLSDVQAEFTDDLRTSHSCDAVICVGAVDAATPSDLVRGDEQDTIVRHGWNGRWMTDDSARNWLDQ